ncbi:hypothetical protein E4T56_gene1382 [Termitomyces sp. T112]|nr:hypothetical protein E4T56_gene1382 [Termitomyces sp. T112]
MPYPPSPTHHAIEPLQNLFSEVVQSLQLSCALPQHTFTPSYAHQSQILSKNSVMVQLQEILQSANKVRDICAANVPVSEDVSEADIWDAAHAKQARAWVEQSLSRVRDLVAHSKFTPASRALKVKPVFNHEYTPFLDKYFEYNAYPSAPDRAALARKSMMTPRQIEVWFQNHRNRARKEGKVLRRLNGDSLPPEISLNSVEDKMPFFVIPEHERKLVSESVPRADDSGEQNTLPTPPTINMTSDALNPPRSSGAFPVPFTHRGVSLSFPITSRTYTFPPPIWYRKPADKSQIPPTTVDMNEFTLHFSQKLHLRAPVSKGTTQSWCLGRVTIPCLAPHPALIRKSPYFLPQSSSMQQLRMSSSYQSHAPRIQPLSSRQGNTVISGPTSDETLSSRKVAHLPKRKPQSSSITHYSGNSVASSPPSRSSATSRSSSCLSRSPSRRSLSSSSSSLSDSPSTPLLLRSSLPEISPSIYVSGFNLNSVESCFNDGGTVPLAVDALHDVFSHPKLRIPLASMYTYYPTPVVRSTRLKGRHNLVTLSQTPFFKLCPDKIMSRMRRIHWREGNSRLRLAVESAGVTLTRPSSTTEDNYNTVPELESSWKQVSSHTVV